jgi:ATP-binding cassette subfamily F protein 3
MSVRSANHPPEGLFVPDAGQAAQRVRNEFEDVAGAQLVATGISGELFDETNISIGPDSITVIIGDNVRARDELATVLAGITPPHTGSINRPADSRTEYVVPSLPQAVSPNQSIKDFFLDGRGILGIEDEISRLYEASIENPSALTRAGELQHFFEAHGGWTTDSDMTEVMSGLNIAANDHDTITPDTHIGELSSGQISKVIIGRALFSKAGVIVMNDPSVHLDVRSKQWLESYVKNSRQAIIVTTSDMEFAENIANKVVEVLNTGSVLQCAMSVPAFLKERDTIINNWVEESQRLHEDIEAQRIHIRDFLAPAARQTDNMAQVKRAAVTKLERMERGLDRMPGWKIMQQRRHANPRQFEVRNPSGVKVIDIPKLTVGYQVDDRPDMSVLEMHDLTIHKGDRVALIGRNGSGKSTLLKAIAQPDGNMVMDGTIDLGPSITHGYYSPYTTLPEGTADVPLRELIARADTRVDVSGIMDFWGFDRSTHYDTRVGELVHADERARAQLALIMARKPNLIMLDEPTSYLTPAFRERLIEALRGYDGTLLTVSHDPNFLQALGLNGILNMQEGKLKQLR